MLKSSGIKKNDIVAVAADLADHTTLVAAVKAAGLVATLKSKVPITIFKPTNAAFDKLPEGAAASLLKPEKNSISSHFNLSYCTT